MFKSKLSKVIVSLLRRIAGVTRSGAKRLMRAMLQTLMAMGRRARLPMAGFVLPTVTMVLLVVILLTVAITLRSFDRANTARNVRVNQQVLAAATPAIDRAKAKIQFMLREDPQRPTATPSDAELYRIMSFDGQSTGGATEADLYTFGDEERLILRADLNGSGSIEPNSDPKGPLVIGGADNEAINTAWRYAVDTNNNGFVDTYTLYGIYFRTPQRDPVSGDFVRARKPLEARTPPMSVTGLLRPECAAAAGTSASLVGNSGWYKIDGRLKKSFFVYTVNVPITENPPANGEIFKGTASISALEYQQDQSRIPLTNNAVVYKDDLDISPGVPLNLNGRIVTNSNLLVSSLSGPNGIKLHLVSSENSCFYDQENSKIVVAGNVVNGNADNGNPSPVEVHLFKKTGPDTGKVINTTNQSVKDTNKSFQVLYNTNAYANRIALLVASQIAVDPNKDPNTNSDPISVKQAMRPPLSQTREQALQAYFEERTRKVPFAEAPLGTTGVGTYNSTSSRPIEGSGDTLRPIEAWILPTGGTATAGNLDGAGRTELALVANGLKATNPIKPNPPEEETFLGDRVVAGNNLPAQRWDGSKFIGSEQTVDGQTPWDGGEATPRTRSPQVTPLADVGAADRDGFWEKAAAQIPKTAVDGIGGLRVVTSAGVYERVNSFLPPPLWDNPTTPAVEGWATYDDPATPTIPEAFPIVWPDSMPMSPVLGAQRVYNNGTADGVAPANNWATAPLPNPDASPPTPLPAKQNPAWGTTIDPSTPKYAKGDLRMRATAVYHYAKGGGYDATVPTPNYDNVRPIACISSYYDPSTAVTARNIDPLPEASGLLRSGVVPTTPRSKTVGSNNGVVYPPPALDRTLSEPPATPGANGLLGGASPNDLQRQANYVFPDGRFANGPLREALLKAPGARNLADKAAIDSTVCALQILAGPTSHAEVEGIKHGAIQEVAFLNAREVKAIERDDLSTPVDETFTLSSPFASSPRPANSQAAWLKGNYNLALEDREPLEIRATQLNIDTLRTIPITQSTTGPKPEWLLPSSGIVFATRDDALPDRSDRSRLSTDPLRPGIDENTSKLVSPTDALLDPTRKPNGIVLVEGDQLFRGAAPVTKTVTDVVKEKGLTLISNLPVYTKGNFNLHGNFAPNSTTFTEIEEFDTVLDKPVPPNNPGWGNFYTRPAGLNKSFACRNGDPRLTCGGDFWRQANVLADSVTLLSENYRFGFRNEGDFDLRNNAGSAVIPGDANRNGSIEAGEVATLKSARLSNGFFTNNFVTNGLTSGAFNANGSGLIPPATTGVTQLGDSDYVSAPPSTINPDQVRDSSYFNNFATPVQRRGKFPEYLMEVCVKLPVAACGPNDWFINPSAGIKASDPAASLNQSYVRSTSLADASNFKAGTTVDPPVPQLQRFPRRVAFQRGVASSNLDDLPGGAPQPLGIDAARKVVAGAGEPKNNSLWFGMTTNGTSLSYDTGSPYLVNRNNNVRDGNGAQLPTVAAASKGQPLLLPVLQIQTVVDAALVRTQIPPGGSGSTSIARNSRWMPPAGTTSQNMIVGSGDNPSRQLTSTSGDFNGGLQNLPRFLENWNNGGTTSNIKGAFIQLNRSAYNTAPYLPILNAVPPPPGVPTPVTPNPTDAGIKSLFFATGLAGTPENRYRTDNGAGRIPFFSPPGRNWGYDVGMLSQSPDLFTQRFTAPPTTTQPAEYFREVPRNDEWVTTLLCGKTAKGDVKAVSDTYRTGC